MTSSMGAGLKFLGGREHNDVAFETIVGPQIRVFWIGTSFGQINCSPFADLGEIKKQVESIRFVRW